MPPFNHGHSSVFGCQTNVVTACTLLIVISLGQTNSEGLVQAVLDLGVWAVLAWWSTQTNLLPRLITIGSVTKLGYHTIRPWLY